MINPHPRPKTHRGHLPANSSPSLARPGFTLVELLVVIAIIVVLAALSLVGINKAIQAARQAKALGPLRELGTASVAYSSDNNGRINTLRWAGDPEEGRPFVGNSFWGRMEPYVFTDIESGSQNKLKEQLKDRIANMFSTKDADKMTGTILQGGKIYHDTSGLPVPVAFNKYLYTWNKWVTLAEVDGGAGTIYMAYGFGIFDELDGEEFAEWPSDGSKPDNNLLYLSNRKAMIAFLDGHVEYYGSPIPKRLYHPQFLDSSN